MQLWKLAAAVCSLLGTGSAPILAVVNDMHLIELLVHKREINCAYIWQ
jgi:hypothetical protein